MHFEKIKCQSLCTAFQRPLFSFSFFLSISTKWSSKWVCSSRWMPHAIVIRKTFGPLLPLSPPPPHTHISWTTGPIHNSHLLYTKNHIKLFFSSSSSWFGNYRFVPEHTKPSSQFGLVRFASLRIDYSFKAYLDAKRVFYFLLCLLSLFFFMVKTKTETRTHCHGEWVCVFVCDALAWHWHISSKLIKFLHHRRKKAIAEDHTSKRERERDQESKS